MAKSQRTKTLSSPLNHEYHTLCNFIETFCHCLTLFVEVITSAACRENDWRDVYEVHDEGYACRRGDSCIDGCVDNPTCCEGGGRASCEQLVRARFGGERNGERRGFYGRRGHGGPPQPAVRHGATRHVWGAAGARAGQ